MNLKFTPDPTITVEFGRVIDLTKDQWSYIRPGEGTYEEWYSKKPRSNQVKFPIDDPSVGLIIPIPKAYKQQLKSITGAPRIEKLHVLSSKSYVDWSLYDFTSSNFKGQITNETFLHTYSFTLDNALIRYVDTDNSIVDDVDNIGWTYRKFPIINPLDRCIWTNDIRFGFAFVM